MIKSLFREDLENFGNYKVNDDVYNIKLDANESFINLPKYINDEVVDFIKSMNFNIYPDSSNNLVCEAYAEYAGVKKSQIVAGNGSDEMIQVLINTFTVRGDKILTCEPDFSMYGVYASISGVDNIIFKLDKDFNLDIEKFIQTALIYKPKVIILSNPNNPTGKVIKRNDIIKIINQVSSFVVIDEAYVEFYGDSIIDLIDKYENLIVLRTCSKAIGLASLRIGFLIANELVIDEINKIKPPFNVNSFTQGVASIVLSKKDYINNNIKQIIEERKFLNSELEKIPSLKIINSYSNFIMIRTNYVKEIYDVLLKNGILVRKFGSVALNNYLRITVGNREQNHIVLNALKEAEELM